jgi:zinc transport system substrate-binding protein
LTSFLHFIIFGLLLSVLPLGSSSGAVGESVIRMGLNDTGKNISSPTLQNSFTNHSKLRIIASFYPIYYFMKEIGGVRVDIETLIPIGVEPHDFEPTIQQIQNAESADMVIYNGIGLEKWIDKINSKIKIDASRGFNPITNNKTKIIGANDPHVWLDPILARQEVENIRDALVKVDPSNSKYYQTNSNKLLADLNNLDARIKIELVNCNMRDFIAFHSAFAYFAKRYGLVQHSIQGISPEGEILPQKIQQIVQLARDLKLHIIFSEDLVDPRSAQSAQVISEEIPNGRVLVLSPIEGINSTEQKVAKDYFDKMNENINNLKIGLQCRPK